MLDLFFRAKKRMDGEDVYGSKIVVSDPIQMDEWNYQLRRNKKSLVKDDMVETGTSILRRTKEDSSFHFNDLYSHKPFTNGENNLSFSQHLDPSFQQQLTKNITPFFPNNISNFTFPKVPNIENLKVIQNPTSYGQKFYINYVENSSGGLEADGDQKKGVLDNRKFNNVLTNQLEVMNGR